MLRAHFKVYDFAPYRPGALSAFRHRRVYGPLQEAEYFDDYSRRSVPNGDGPVRVGEVLTEAGPRRMVHFVSTTRESHLSCTR